MARLDVLSDLRHDVTFALRLLRRSPLVALTAVLTLGLGIGATTAIFSVVYAVLLQPLPYPAPDRLYDVHMLYPDGSRYSLSAPDFMSVRQDARAFEQIEAVDDTVGHADRGRAAGSAHRAGQRWTVPAARRSMPSRAATFLADEHAPGRGAVVVLGHAFWMQAFGGDRSVIGRVLTFGDGRFEVVGVLTPGARLIEAADVYRPLTYGPTFDATTSNERRSEFLTVIGRARPGVDVRAASADLRAVGGRLQQAFPDTNAGMTMDARPLADVVIGDVRTPLLMLLGAVAFVLLVACANVAHLLLARVSARRAELGVRAALGATRGRIARQLLVESGVLGVLGGAFGLAIAVVGIRLLVAAQPADIPRLDGVALSQPVLLVGLLSTLGAGLLLGALPAWQASGLSLTHRAARRRTRCGGVGRVGPRSRVPGRRRSGTGRRAPDRGGVVRAQPRRAVACRSRLPSRPHRHLSRDADRRGVPGSGGGPAPRGYARGAIARAARRPGRGPHQHAAALGPRLR